MEFKAYVCPQCGAALQVDDVNTNITVCPKCGSSIHITYKANENQSALSDFVTPDGIKIASAYVPSSYKLNAFITDKWQSVALLFLRLRPNTAFCTLLLTMMATPFLLRDSCPQ